VAVVTTALLGTPTHQMKFTFLVLIDVFFSVIVCSLTVVSAYILKRRIPPEEVPFKTPGGKPVHNLLILLVLFFCIVLVLTNGTDYFLGGYIVMFIIPIWYIVSKWIWGGTAKKEPELYHVNPKTKLSFGDLRKIGFYFTGFGLIGVISRFFLQWYDGQWALGYAISPSDFTDYETEIQKDYPSLVVPAGDVLPKGEYSQGDLYIPGWFEQQYGHGLFANFDAMLNMITILGICATVAGLIVLFVSRTVDKEKEITKIA
jgi:hypothetical protein